MNNLDVDITGAKQLLESLSTKKIMGIEKKALRKAANVLRKQARSNFRKVLPMASKSGKYSDTLLQGVLSSTVEGKDGVDAKVHIMGSRKKTSGTFRARFFEGGTQVRKTKKGYNRGKLKAYNFFAPAVSSTKDKVLNTLDTELSKTIQQIADKKYG